VTGAGLSTVLLFVKAPVRGQVKSRLASELGQDAALELYRGFVQDILATIDAGGYDCTVCVHPPDARDRVAEWLGRHRRCLPQRGNDLGTRMENAFHETFASGASQAILVGSDIPDLPGQVFFEAFSALHKNDAVIGPAADGGYYLVGFRKDTFRPEVFRDIAWSTGGVFSETMEHFNRAGARVHMLQQWQDVDTPDDLRSLQRRANGTSFERSRSMTVINRLCGTMK